MEQEPFDVIINSKGKAKGVAMSQQNDNTIKVQEVVGLTKTQLFLLVLSTMLIGGLLFGLGFYFNKDHELVSMAQNIMLNKVDEKYNIGLSRYNNNYNNIHQNMNNNTSNTQYQTTKTVCPQQIQSKQDNFEQFHVKHFYILIGKYENMEEAEKVQNKIQIKAGKNAVTKQTNEGVILYIGPFESESLAKNEKIAIYSKSSIMGSIINDV